MGGGGLSRRGTGWAGIPQVVGFGAPVEATTRTEAVSIAGARHAAFLERDSSSATAASFKPKAQYRVAVHKALVYLDNMVRNSRYVYMQSYSRAHDGAPCK